MMIQILTLLVAGLLGLVHVEGTTTTGARCIYSCDGLPTGDYQSCNECNVYASCVDGGTMFDNRACAADFLVWDDNSKRCDYTSDTCSGPVPCSMMSTSTAYEYIDIANVDRNIPFTFTFKVQTCNDAHVGIYRNTINERPDGRVMYEIVIGGWGNTQSVIRRRKQQEKPRYTDSEAGRVSCSEFRDFWITYDDGSIRVGEGNVAGIGQFMEWDDPRPINVKRLGVSTGWGSTGEWCYSI